MDFKDGRYRAMGTPEEIGKEAKEGKVLNAIRSRPLTIKEIAAETDLDEKTVRKVVEGLWRDKFVTKEGIGAKGSPYRFKENPILSQEISIGEEMNFMTSGPSDGVCDLKLRYLS